MTNLQQVRARAWATRRKKYGPHGHSGSYTRPATGPCRRCERLLDLIIDLHVAGVLSEGQVARATGLRRVDVRKRADAVAYSGRG